MSCLRRSAWTGSPVPQRMFPPANHAVHTTQGAVPEDLRGAALKLRDELTPATLRAGRRQHHTFVGKTSSGSWSVAHATIEVRVIARLSAGPGKSVMS